jgi:hypothetical protein
MTLPLDLDAMRHVPRTLPFSHAMRLLTHSGAIEWEELPSLADSLAERLVVLGTRHRDAIAAARSRAMAFERAASMGHVWDATRPAELEPARPPQPFVEPLAGLSLREVDEPDVFRHFFGKARNDIAPTR